jgi:AcrR family transcriptional regulator
MKHATKQRVRDRIVATACDLFYRQGYRATGINQVIAESGVAKASFYDHFPSKADLLEAYAAATAERELDDLRTEVMALPTARERFFGPLRVLPPWFESSGYRGCPFQNVVAEAVAEAPAVQTIVRGHRENVRGFLRELIENLKAEAPDSVQVDTDTLADVYLLLFEGAIAVAASYREAWPVETALAALERFLKAE